MVLSRKGGVRVRNSEGLGADQSCHFDTAWRLRGLEADDSDTVIPGAFAELSHDKGARGGDILYQGEESACY